MCFIVRIERVLLFSLGNRHVTFADIHVDDNQNCLSSSLNIKEMTDSIAMDTVKGIEDTSNKCYINNHSSLLVRLVISETDCKSANEAKRRWQRAACTLAIMTVFLIVLFVLLFVFIC